jgi:prepilin-type processing-associated H-X9-DG protein
MYVYSLDSGVFPEVCDSLSIAGRFTPSQLECTEGSLSSTPKPYVIVAGQSPLSDPNNLLAYETADNHARPNRPAGRNVLLVDGHVEFLEEPAFQSALARTRANLARSATQSTSPAAQRAASE